MREGKGREGNPNFIRIIQIIINNYYILSYIIMLYSFSHIVYIVTCYKCHVSFMPFLF